MNTPRAAAVNSAGAGAGYSRDWSWPQSGPTEGPLCGQEKRKLRVATIVKEGHVGHTVRSVQPHEEGGRLVPGATTKDEQPGDTRIARAPQRQPRLARGHSQHVDSMGGVCAMSLDDLKRHVRAISAKYDDREQRARRLFIEERAASLHFQREREFTIRTDISQFFNIAYSAVSFCGSAQLGFSIHKDKLFEPAASDLDAACVDVELFQKAWIDVVTITRAFTDLTPFGTRAAGKIDLFKEQILKRGMIRVDAMPQSELSLSWSRFQGELSRQHAVIFRGITLAIYMNEYAFCWKQDSALSRLIG